MAEKLNRVAETYAKSLIKQDKVDRDSSWSFSAEDGSRLLGPDGDDWKHFGKYHLGIHPDADEDTKAHYGYPIGKGGKVYRHGIIAAKSRAAQQNDSVIEAAADELLKMIDKDKEVSGKDGLRADGSFQASRTDLFDWRDWQTEKMEHTAEGFMKGRAVVTNIGVFPYQNDDGTTRYELRHPDDVFHADSIASLDGKPLTNDHPVNGVTPVTARFLSVGAVHSPMHDPYHLTAGITILNADAIQAVEMGKLGLSCGYDCDVVPEVGNYHGTPFTHRQTRIRYNHVALVDAGRAGDAARLRMDGVQVHQTTTPKGSETMKRFTLDTGTVVDVDEAVHNQLVADKAAKENFKSSAEKLSKESEDAKRNAEDAAKSLDEAKKELDAKMGEIDALKEKISKLEKDCEDMKANGNEDSIKSRVALLTEATKLGATVDASMSVEAIHAAVISLASPDFKSDGKSVEYLKARYDGAVELLSSATPYKPATGPGGSSHSDNRPAAVQAEARSDLAAARKNRLNELSTAWETKPNKDK